MYSHIRTGLSGLLASLILSGAALADLGTYNQDFETLGGGMTIGDGWLFFNNVIDNGTTLFGYGGAAPDGTGQISAIAEGEGGVDQGVKQLSVFSDYNCCFGTGGDPDTGHQGGVGETSYVETNVYQEQTIGATDVGTSWSFGFEVKRGNLGGATTAFAFIRVLDPNNEFSLTHEVAVELTTTPQEWSGGKLEITVGDWVGQRLQFGFQSNADNFDGAGMFYDNVGFGPVGSPPPPDLTEFSDNMESYDPVDPGALGNAGYLVFGNVFDPFGGFVGEYGPFPAPNSTAPTTPAAFSGIALEQGGPPQGLNVLVVFNDYENGDAHNAGNFVESNFYREYTITAAHVGQTWLFSYDAKAGDLASPTTASAFIKVLDPNGFMQTDIAEQNMTSTPVDWTRFKLAMPIAASYVGQVIQIGFSNTAQSFSPSGVFYDNLNFAAGVDSDEDGVFDANDNCTLVANPDQLDSDMDGMGNLCDGDLNQDCIANLLDLLIFRSAFLAQEGDANYRPEADFNGDGIINLLDLLTFRAQFLQRPGPPDLCEVPAARKRLHRR